MAKPTLPSADWHTTRIVTLGDPPRSVCTNRLAVITGHPDFPRNVVLVVGTERDGVCDNAGDQLRADVP